MALVAMSVNVIDVGGDGGDGGDSVVAFSADDGVDETPPFNATIRK